jgi:hypothetical protein
LFNDIAGASARQTQSTVWIGTARTWRKISVTFAGYMVATMRMQTGKWRVNLPADHTPTHPPTNLRLKGKNTVNAPTNIGLA